MNAGMYALGARRPQTDGENFYVATISAGNVSANQPAPVQPFR